MYVRSQVIAEAEDVLAGLGKLVARTRDMRALGDDSGAEAGAFLRLLAPMHDFVERLVEWLDEAIDAADEWEAFLREHPEL